MKTKLRELRKSRNMTQAELAEISGVHLHTISKIECELQKNIFLGTLQKLAHGLDVTVKEIIGS